MTATYVYGSRGATCTDALIGERIDDTHAGVNEIRTVAGGDGQIVEKRRGRDETVLDRHGLAGPPEVRQQFRPLQAGICVPRQTVEMSDSSVEPSFQSRPLPALGKDENPESQFAKNHRIDGDLRFVGAKPLDHSRIRSWFGWLTQNVGIDQILHNASVDSESMGTKKPFSGQARSQSTVPSFCGAGRRVRR